ncbi:MAG: ankyrin repeat domain-containing protein [Planctomycetota bacterium]
MAFGITSRLVAQQADDDPYYSPLHEAAREGDTDKIKELLGTGVDVNLKNRYRLTALYYASDRGHESTVELLLDSGAETEIPNEPYYRLNPLIMAARKNHAGVVRLLLQKDAQCGSWLASWPASLGHTEVVKTLVELRPDTFNEASLNQLAGIAKSTNNKALFEYLENKGAKAELPKPSTINQTLSKTDQKAIDGVYQTTEGDESVRIWARRGKLYLGDELELALELERISEQEFQGKENQSVRLKLQKPWGQSLTIVDANDSNSVEASFVRSSIDANSASTRSPRVTGRWPRFRGEHGDGNADGFNLPVKFDATTGEGVLWKTKIPGLGHSSPVIWNDKVFLTSAEAISDDPKYDMRIASGFDTHTEDIEYRWIAVCIDLNSGKLIWKKQLDEGLPKAQRHVMSSHANCTPAVDDEFLVINLAGQGLFCLSHDGEILWKKDLGRLAAGWFMDPGYEWGFASSPILHNQKIYVQCDVFGGAFIAALSARDGSKLWRTERQEISSWATPLLLENDPSHPQLIVNGTRAICSYDPVNGKELWRVEDNSEVTVASPIRNGSHVIVTGGYQPVRPIFSVDVSQRGNLTPKPDATKNKGLQWWTNKGGAYGVTPIIDDGILYIFHGNGILTTYRSDTGEQIYKQRIGSRTGDIVASPIVSDGKIFLAGGDGDVFVIPTGEEFQKATVCPIGEQVMATPAAAANRLLIRGVEHLYCLANEDKR